MKTIASISLLAICVLSSCKKPYTCECFSQSGSGLYTSPVSKTTIKATSKSEAVSDCQAMIITGEGCYIQP